MRTQSAPRSKTDRAERVRDILARRGLTLAQVSHKSTALYGHSSPYFVPHNLYYDLRLETFSPSVYQMSALSRISGYRLHDWMRVFGLYPEDIPRLQVLLPAKSTIVLDPSLDDPQAWVPWFQNRGGIPAAPTIAPLGRVLQFTHPRRLESLSEINNRTFLYAKIGRRDAFAFPELLPGSIVRMKPVTEHVLSSLTPGSVSEQIFLIEHDTGSCCSRLHLSGNGRITLASTQLARHQQVELQRPHEVALRGVVDLEIRSLASVDEPKGLQNAAPLLRPEALSSTANLGHLIRRARRIMALSFREASTLSRRIADLLGNEQYFISSSSLSDYETCDLSPRHVHKIITLCVLYGMKLSTFLRTAGIALEETGQEPIPDQLIPRLSPSGMQDLADDPDRPEYRGFLGDLISLFAEVPLFLRGSLGALSGVSNPSLQDFFWTGGTSTALQPYLLNTFLVVVNRRKKKLRYYASIAPWRQPVYLLVERGGTYTFGSCALENGLLVIYPDVPPAEALRKLRYPRDADVVGQIVTIARTL